MAPNIIMLINGDKTKNEAIIKIKTTNMAEVSVPFSL
jgi:hypothetical protein